jgi:glycosyltransferase involved in cell wall biosynthesis
LEWLLKDIWPRIIKELPAAQLHVIGEWSAEEQSPFARPGVTFRGFVKELSPVLQGGIMLVPLRIGSGLRVKILTALTLGVPVVTTSIGAEGLLVNDGTDILVADSPEPFAAAAVQLAKNPAQWSAMAQAGRTAVKQNYSPAAVRARRNEIYQSMLAQKTTAA